MTLLEAKQELSRKLNIDYNDIANNDLFTESDLGAWIQAGIILAWDYKPWDFTEEMEYDVTTASTLYYAYPQDYVSGSIFLLRVNGKRYKKILFHDYLAYLEENPTGTDKVWAESNRLIYINANAYGVGETYELYGKLKAPQLANPSDILPFSPDVDNQEYSGNGAIVQLAYSEALASEKKKNYQGSELERKKAYETLNVLWKPFGDLRALQQSKDSPFFDVPNYFGNNGFTPGNFDL